MPWRALGLLGFWYVTLHNLRSGHLPVPAALRPIVVKAADAHAVVLTAWYLTIAALIAVRFWPYWSSLAT